MFLDDELLQICEQAKISSSKDVYSTADKVFQRCVKYLQENVSAGTPKAEAYVTIRRSFKLFDTFVNKLRNHQNFYVRGFYNFFRIHTWEKQFLSSVQGKIIYEECEKFHKIYSSWN